MTLHFIKTVLGIVCLICTVLHALPIDLPEIPLVEDLPIVEDVAKFLLQYGYIEELPTELNMDVLTNPVKDFQEFVGLNVTGALNDETIAKMKAPRCGMKDIIRKDSIGRNKRFAIEDGEKWPRNNLTYRLKKLPTKIQDKDKVRHEMSRALKMWSDVSMLSFKEESAAAVRVDVDIDFFLGQHGDFFDFDGVGGVLAHAFYPSDGGGVHFDDAEDWTINEKSGTVVIQVAVHEFGHSLGLGHSKYTTSAMSPFFTGYNPNYRLDEDDIKGIQSLYGEHDGKAPDLCQDASLDAITRTKDGSTYVFKGEWYWQLIGKVTAKEYPRRISDDWKGLEGNLDAAFTDTDGITYFFKGGRYWSFTNKEKNDDPNLISRGFQGIPDNLDAAFTWSVNDIPYFFKANEYWPYVKYNNPQATTKSLIYWTGLPVDGVDAAFVWEDKRSYFFRGAQYYLYETNGVPVADPPYPRSTARDWFSCPKV